MHELELLKVQFSWINILEIDNLSTEHVDLKSPDCLKADVIVINVFFFFCKGWG